jgi:hypothetical protein
MALSEKASQAIKGQADELVAEIWKIEEPIENLVAERDGLQKKIDEIQETSHDLKEAANVLMDLIGEEKPYDIPKRKEVVDYRKPGPKRGTKKCDACGETVYVSHAQKKCPLDGCDGRVERYDPEDDLESDDDIDPDPDDDEEPDRSDPPTPADEEDWRRPGPNKVKKGCNRCNRAVYVLPHCTICPDEVCRGNLVNAKK